MPRLHYGNARLAGLPEYQHRRLQSVMNAAARLIYQKSRCQHVTPLLRELYWLRSRERVDFKLAVFIFQCLHGLVRATYPITYVTSPTPTVGACVHHRRPY